MITLASFALGAALAQDPVDDGLGILITQDGLENVDTLATALPIEPIPLDDTSVRECYALLCWTCLEEYAFSVSNLWVDLQVNSVDIDTSSGVIDLEAELAVQINDSSDKFTLYYELLCAGTTCPSYVDPFLATVNMPMSMAVVEQDGVPFVDVTVDAVTVAYDLTSDHIHLDCSLQGFEDFLNILGLSVYDWILSLVQPEIDAAIADIAPEIEAALEDAIAAATVDTTIDALGTELSVSLLPGDIAIGESGVEVWLDSHISATQSACVAELDQGEFPRTSSDRVGAAGLPAGTHAGVTLDDDMVNQALYAAWRGGLLCQQIDSELAGGFTLDTTLLDLLLPGAYDGLFDEEEPGELIIETSPQVPPVADFSGEAAIGLRLDRFGLDLIAELDDRAARVLGAELETPITLPMAFDDTTGELTLEVGLDSSAIEIRVMTNEISQASSEALTDSLASSLPSLIDTALGAAVPDLAFSLPALEGIGVQSIDAQAVGTDEETLGILVNMGPVTYEGMTCADLESGEGCTGCEDSGACGGCSSAGAQSRWMWAAFMPLLVAVRRRRRRCRA